MDSPSSTPSIPTCVDPYSAVEVVWQSLGSSGSGQAQTNTTSLERAPSRRAHPRDPSKLCDARRVAVATPELNRSSLEMATPMSNSVARILLSAYFIMGSQEIDATHRKPGGIFISRNRIYTVIGATDLSISEDTESQRRSERPDSTKKRSTEHEANEEGERNRKPSETNHRRPSVTLLGAHDVGEDEPVPPVWRSRRWVRKSVSSAVCRGSAHPSSCSPRTASTVSTKDAASPIGIVAPAATV